MTRISHRKLNKVVEERCLEIFWQTTADLKTPEEMKAFFTDLFSYTEMIMVAKRLAIAAALNKGYTYQQIYDLFKVSTPTISAVHKQIMIGKEGYQNALKKLMRRENWESFWDVMDQVGFTLSKPARYSSTQYEKKREAGKAIYKRKTKREIL